MRSVFNKKKAFMCKIWAEAGSRPGRATRARGRSSEDRSHYSTVSEDELSELPACRIANWVGAASLRTIEMRARPASGLVAVLAEGCGDVGGRGARNCCSGCASTTVELLAMMPSVAYEGKGRGCALIVAPNGLGSGANERRSGEPVVALPTGTGTAAALV